VGGGRVAGLVRAEHVWHAHRTSSCAAWHQSGLESCVQKARVLQAPALCTIVHVQAADSCYVPVMFCYVFVYVKVSLW